MRWSVNSDISRKIIDVITNEYVDPAEKDLTLYLCRHSDKRLFIFSIIREDCDHGSRKCVMPFIYDICLVMQGIHGQWVFIVILRRLTFNRF